MKIFIYDMDGCIVNSLHRYRVKDNGKIDLQYWRDNEYRTMQDTLLPLAEQYQEQLLDDNCYVIIATARIVDELSMQFIKEILGMPDKIIGRKCSSDLRGGAELKINGLRYLKNLKQFKNAEKHYFEDNTDYLRDVCDFLDCHGTYIPSKQGH
jgi:hypothetical protein